MNIIGWIRQGDMASCGGIVAEGLSTATSNGVPYSYQGARMACSKNCVIAEGYARSTLVNGRHRAIHGMATSAGCPLYSTINDFDGVGNESGDPVPEKHFLNADGRWTPILAATANTVPYDERVRLVALPIEGLPYYLETLDGRTYSGRAGGDGLLPRTVTYGEDEYMVYWGDEALARMEGAAT